MDTTSHGDWAPGYPVDVILNIRRVIVSAAATLELNTYGRFAIVAD